MLTEPYAHPDIDLLPYNVSEIHTGKLGIFLLALLFRAALLLDFWNFSY